MRFLAAGVLVLITALSLPAQMVHEDPPAPIVSARQMLSELGIGDSELSKFVSGKPLSAEELEILGRVLSQFHFFPSNKMRAWARQGFGSARLIDDPESYRGELVSMKGRAERVVVEPLPAELAERLDMEKLYRCKVALDDGGRAEVFTEHVPAAWPLDAPLDEPVSFAGVFLKTMPAEAAVSSPTLVFAAERLAWHRRSRLGKLGMDYGLLEGLEHRKPIAASEARAFYRFLEAASQANLDELLAATKGQEWTVIPKSPAAEKLAAQLRAEKPNLHVLFLGQAEEMVGELTAFEGRVRRCVRVPITDPDLAEQLGIREYYELVVFINLDYRLAFGSQRKDAGDKGSQENSGVRKEVNTYPVFVCVPHLPAGFPTGDKLNEMVRAPGFFFKLWAYPTTFAVAEHAKRIEYSPLVMGPGVKWLSHPRPVEPSWAITGSAAFVFLVAVVAFFLWRTANRDREFRRKFLNRENEHG